MGSTGERGRAGERREATLALLAQEPAGLSSGKVAARLGISRQAAFAHLSALAESGQAERIGRGRGTRYRLRTSKEPSAANIGASVLQRVLEPGDSPWSELASMAPFEGMSASASRLFADALERMLRGARQRAPESALRLAVFEQQEHVMLELTDSGEGLFRWTRRQLASRSVEDARLALSKGLGDDDLRWLVRASDLFEVESDGLRWRVDNLRADQTLGSLESPRDGTRVRFWGDPLRPMNVDALGDTQESHALVRLFATAESFVSRDEARALMRGLEDARRVVLDFGGVSEIGEAFAEEIFCVWAESHVRVRLDPIRMRACVAEAILRVRRGG
ncbi:MAG: DUF4325 domain-containing protein [Deltaproteobacteria bacterium]|nr:DUF4325 domain-containing protein [Deltaproteobacteria bacterium]